MRSTLSELIDDLADRADGPVGGAHRDKDPADACEAEGACSPLPVHPIPGDLSEGWTREGAVLCISGRGFLDAAAVAILAQILAKRGIGARTVPFSETASARLSRLDPGAARIACVVSIAHGGEPQHLNRLIARLRERMPAVPVLAGLWLTGQEERRPPFTLDADITAGSLHEAVEAVLAAAELDATVAPRPRPEAPEPVALAPAVVGQGA